MNDVLELPPKFAARRDAYLEHLLQDSEPHGTLFFGDSGFDPERFWTHFPEDVPAKNACNVAISGTRVCDWEALKNDLVLPLAPDVLVIHLGGNDFNADRHTPWRVFDDLTALIRSLGTELPNARIYLLALEPKPAGSRFFATNYGRNTLNPMLAEWCNTAPNVCFVDTAKAFLLPNGTVNKALYKEDLIHPADRVYPDIFLPCLRAAGCRV